jgi:hypothetical protein
MRGEGTIKGVFAHPFKKNIEQGTSNIEYRRKGRGKEKCSTINAQYSMFNPVVGWASCSSFIKG